MKKFLSIVLAMTMLLLASGCSSANGNNKKNEPAKDPAPTEGKELSGKVVVYSPHGEEILDAVSEWFYEETGVEVEYLFMGGGELVDRIRAEKANPQADVIFGNPSNVFEQMKRDELLAPSNPSWASELNSNFVDVDGYFYGTIQTPVMLFYNNTILDENTAPKDWSDLADPAYKDMIIMRSVTSAASRATISAMIEQYDKDGKLDPDGWDFMKALDANTKKYVTDSNLMFQGIAKGEGAIGFWTLDGITKNIDENKMPLTIVAPESGAVVISDGIALINGAKNEENARAFIEFVGSEEVQLRLANEFNRMPTLPSALEKAPAWMGNMDFDAMDINWGTLTDKQADWMQYYNDEIVDAAKSE